MEFLQSFSNYFFNAIDQPILSWIKIWGITFICCYLFILLLVKINHGKTIFLRPFLISQKAIIAYSIVAFVLIFIIIWKWNFTHFFVANLVQFIYLSCLFIIVCLQLISVVKLSGFFDRNKTLIIFPPSVGIQSFRKDRKNANKTYNKLKIWLLLPFFAFLLLLIPKNDKNLVSIIIDNSSSMGDLSGGGNSPIEIGKSAIATTLSELDPNTEVVLSWFSLPQRVDYRSSINEIISTQNSQSLVASNNGFVELQNAINYLNNLEVIGPTPLMETIWSNYLFCDEFSKNKIFVKKIAVVITDGAESVVPNDVGNFNFCPEEGFGDFFDNISIINLNGDLNSPFFNNAYNCSLDIEENGMDETSYSDALKRFLDEFSKDWNFIIWLALITAIPALISLIIPVRKY